MDGGFSANAQAAGDSEVDLVVDVEDVPADSVEPPEDSLEPVDPPEESVEPPEDSPDEEEFDDVSLDVELDASEERLSLR